MRRQPALRTPFQLEIAGCFERMGIQPVGMSRVVPQRHETPRVIEQIRIGRIFDTEFRRLKVKGAHDTIRR